MLCGRYVDDYNYWKFYGAKDTYNYSFLYQAYNNNNEFITQLEKAYSYLKRAVDLYHELQLQNISLLSRTYSNLANTCFNMNRFEEAIQYHLLALAGREKELGNCHEKVITTRRRLGTSYLTIGEPETALAYYKTNLDAVLQAKTEGSIITAKCWFDCGRAYHACGKQDDAMHCFTMAARFVNELKNTDLFACAQICYEIACFLVKISRAQYQKAEELLTFGKSCLTSLDSKLADSLSKTITEMLDDMKQPV
jgi:tetratricopeptide (TPR) repeat protein